MRAPFALVFLLAGVFLAGGCTPEQVRRAEAVAAQAEARLAQATEALTAAQAMLAEAQAIAQATGSPQAVAAVEATADVVSRLSAALPALQGAAQDAREGARIAAERLEAGAGWFDTILQVGVGLLAGGGLAGGLATRVLGKWKPVALTAVRLAQDLKPAAEAHAKATGDVTIERAIKTAAAEQARAGVQPLVDAIRYRGG